VLHSEKISEDDNGTLFERTVLLQLGCPEPHRKSFPSSTSAECGTDMEERWTFGLAFSRVLLTRDEWLPFFRTDPPCGLGQFFLQHGLQPHFSVINMGRDYQSGRDHLDFDTQLKTYPWIASWIKRKNLWRKYRLEADGVTCTIMEVLAHDVLESVE
jgi:hypothetical protein